MYLLFGSFSLTMVIIYVLCTFSAVIIIFLLVRGYCIMLKKGTEALVIFQDKLFAPITSVISG